MSNKTIVLKGKKSVNFQLFYWLVFVDLTKQLQRALRNPTEAKVDRQWILKNEAVRCIKCRNFTVRSGNCALPPPVSYTSKQA